jgi:serine-type D-Ala-D-Ala carboxypeptidase/endopeptidase (penicillin-binding protein 4)
MKTFAAIASLLLAACSAGVRTAPEPRAAAVAALRQSIDSMVGDPKFRNAHWGILIVDPVRGDTLYSRNAGKLFMPASNQKIITGAVALSALGRDYRFRTALVARGPVAGGVLEGDLEVVGSGDPTYSDRAIGDARTRLLAIADSLRHRGISRIEGRITAGGDAFPDSPLGFGWAWDDLGFPYSAGVDELMLNEGFGVVLVKAGTAAGEPVTAATWPAREYPLVRIAARTVARDTAAVRQRLRVEWDASGDTVTLTGEIMAGDSARLEIAYRDVQRAFFHGLKEALAERGITVRGRDIAPRVADTLLAVYSEPLSAILPHMQKPSQNQIAEVVFKTIGREVTGVGTADSARRAVERQLVAWGADTAGFAVRDGSGLSRHDYLTPETIVKVLDAMRRSAGFEVFYASLPVAGVDGTIRNRMRGTAAQGNVRAKTGFVDKARSLSGYVTDADGGMLMFSMLCNNWTVPVRDVERVQDTIASALARLSRSSR